MTAAREPGLVQLRPDYLDHIAMLALAAMALALPWELFQQIPLLNITIAKLAGVVVILCAIVRAIILRRAFFRRIGIEAPVAVLALSCGVSTVYSLDRAATLRQIAVYITYFAFVYATTHFVSDAAKVRRIMHAYILSVTVLACATLACYAGLLWPTVWATSDMPLQRLLLEYRDGVAMRMVAAGNDFNQAAMHVLVAFVGSLFLYETRPLKTPVRVALLVAQAMMFATMLITMSRSAVLIAAGFAALSLIASRRRSRAMLAVVGIAVVAAGIALVFASSGFIETFLHRAQGGIAHDDSSIRGRWQVYRIALSLVPQYAVRGCGFGAVDAALAASKFRDQAVMTVHSMPLKLLLELGVVGLAAYLWLWFNLLKRVRLWSISGLARQDSAGRAVGAGALSVFIMTIVQPFPFLSLYPFLMALICGPATLLAADDLSDRRWQRRGACAAVLLVAATVTINCVLFQRATSQLEQIVDDMERGLHLEQSARWHDAALQFRAAAAAASSPRSLSQGGGQYGHHWFDRNNKLSWDLVDPDPLLLALNVSWERPDLEAVARYREGRAFLLGGEVREAQKALETAWGRDDHFFFARFDLAEALWTIGDYAPAIRLYEAAATHISVPLPERVREHIRIAQKRADDATRRRHFTTLDNHWRSVLVSRLDALQGRADEQAQLEKAMTLRRLGRWREALAVYAQVAAQDPQCAEALFNLDVGREIAGK